MPHLVEQMADESSFEPASSEAEPASAEAPAAEPPAPEPLAAEPPTSESLTSESYTEESLARAAPSGPAPEVATADLLSAVDDGTLSGALARDLEGQGADLQQGLAYAISIGRTAEVLILADECAVRLEDDAAPVSIEEVLKMASQGDWADVAFQVALAADGDSDVLDGMLAATDAAVQKKLRESAGEVHVQLPRDLRLSFARTGKLPPVLLVEQPRWLLPRPREDQCFIVSRGPKTGRKLEEGWYCVVQYPVGDDLREAVLRRKYWEGAYREVAASVLRSEGETLVCKAAKANQWALVEALIEHGNTLQLTEQVQTEFLGLWEYTERCAFLHSREDLASLCAYLDDSGMLSRPWRHGPLAVPSGAKLKRPTLTALRDALALDSLSAALKLIDGAKVAFSVSQAEGATQAWLRDLLTLDENTFAYPLLHRAVEAGRTDLTTTLLQALVSVEARDSKGFTALAVAATSKQWGAMDVLLREGCRVEGKSGALAKAAMQRASRPGPHGSAEEAQQAANLLERALERQQRPPASTLAEYFQRQLAGEVVHGLEPRKFELKDGALQLRDDNLRVFIRAMTLESNAPRHEIRFVATDSRGFATALDVGIMDLCGRPLLREQELISSNTALAIPVAVPCERLGPEAPDRPQVLGAMRKGPAIPLLARAPPPGGLLVESRTSCCAEPIGRVELVVDGIRIGETREQAVCGEVEILLPAKEFEVVAELSGRRLLMERKVGGPDAKFSVDVSIAVYIYVLLIDEEERLEFVFVCGHRRDLPEDAKPFVGKVTWDTGSERLSKHQPVVLGEQDCLERLRTMVLAPDLPSGRCFEAVEWEDTSTDDVKACQFQRCLNNPVRIGKIFNQ